MHVDGPWADCSGMEGIGYRGAQPRSVRVIPLFPSLTSRKRFFKIKYALFIKNKALQCETSAVLFFYFT